ncbi:MAG: hypothetical protein KGL53_15745 [Elusimicrobia bacterium]|nr:hypothetical protein [Elusimicrobiota bacterium]
MRAPLALALLLAAAPAGAVWDDTGGAAMQFLRLGTGARALGMGEAYGPVVSGPESVYWNPAGLARVPAPELTYSHSEMLSFLHHEHAAFAWPLWGGGAGVGVTFFHQDGLPLITNSNQRVGDFTPHSEAVSLAWGRSFSVGEDNPALDRGYFRELWSRNGAWQPLGDDPEMWTGSLDGGAALKFVSDTIYDKSAWALALDAGVQFHPVDMPQASLSAVLRNLGTRPRYVNESESLPLEGSLGGAYRFGDGPVRFLPALEAAFPAQGKPYGKLGVEYSMPVQDVWRVALRAGYKSLTAPDLGPLSGLSGGVGLAVGGLSVDLAFQPMAVLGEVFRGSISWRFDRSLPRRRRRPDGWIRSRGSRRPAPEKPAVEVEPERPHY